MSRPHWFSSFRTALLLLLAAVMLAIPARAEESLAAQSERFKRENEKQTKQLKQEFEEKTKNLRLGAPKSSQQSHATKSAQSAAKFDPKSAPSPQECFAAYLNAVRKAKSYQEVLPYLPAHKREYYEREQKAFDPKRARERRLEYEKAGKLDAEAIIHLTSPPFERGLKMDRNLAQAVNKFVSAQIEGDKAFLDITIHVDTVIDGVRYTKGTATVGMVGEGNYWKFDSYKQDIVVER